MTTSPTPDSFASLLAARRSDRPALLAPDRPPLSYAGLDDLAATCRAQLAAQGVGRGDRVAIVLPNGPEMAAAFLAVGSGATTCPLNPAYRHDEFAFYLEDLNAKALVLPAGSDSPAAAAAKERGIALLELSHDETAAAGTFTLSPAGEPADAPVTESASERQDLALILHTSGTTSRPKIVPLSQANLLASASNIGNALALTAEDRCLNVMPLFHIHGLIAAVLSSLFAGGSIVCTPGFNALRFMSWLEATKPSWYTAVPTMHQAILARGKRQPDAAKAAGLRFIRSSSASLPPQVMQEVEALFGCPVIESYGMTEASHQMASNALPPGQRKPGSVGLPAGPEVALLTEAGEVTSLAAVVGEVIIRGANVTAGYESNPKANAEGFLQDEGGAWFRTGDQGTFDADGYLTITGRLKEIINRGGEKVSPREVDEVLLDHAAVAQAVTFAMPHSKLGEEVAAAVVLAEGEALEEAALKEFLAARLADFKVPRKIIFLDEIPKGPTGKLQRIGLADKLGLGAKA
ncbi:MAG: acyl--CoA ligase [Pseudomonadota bacterium]